MKLSKKVAISFITATLVGGLVFFINNTNAQSSSSLKAEEELTTNPFKKIADGWNPNKSDFEGKDLCNYVLEFKNMWTDSGESIHDNLVSGKVGELITLNGESLKSYDNPNIKVAYSHGGKYFNIVMPKTIVTPIDGGDKCVIYIPDNVPFYNYSLPEMTLTIDPSTYVMSAEAKEVTSVDFTGLTWNKENKDAELFGDKKGLLISLSSKIFDGTSDNLLDTSFGKNITLNNVAFKNLSNPEIRLYNSKNLWLYADELNVVGGTRNTLNMIPTKFNGVDLGMFTYYLESSNSLWSSYYENGSRSLELYYHEGSNTHGSAWPSNRIYEGSGNPHRYAGGNYVSGEKNGYLLSFVGSFSKDSKGRGGFYKYVNLAKEEIGHHIYSNGIPFAEIEGAELMYMQEAHMWLWTPNLYEPYKGKNYAEISIDKDTLFFDTVLPEMHIYHEDWYDVDTFSEANLWHVAGYDGYTAPVDRNPNYLTLDERVDADDTWLGPYSWNNHEGDGATIISYGHNAADLKDKEEDPTIPTTFLCSDEQGNCKYIMKNMATKDYSVGYKLKLNGVPICKIPDATVNYQNGENFFTFIINEKYCMAFNGYKLPTLTLEDGTNFLDVSLQGFTIYFYEGKWHKEPLQTVSDTELYEASKYSDVFSLTDFNDVTNECAGNIDSSNALTFEFRTESSSAAFAINAFGSSNDTGLSLMFDIHNQMLTAYNGSNSIGTGAYSCRFDIEEWTRVYIKFVRNGNSADILIGVNDAVIISISGYQISNVNKFGNVMYLYTNDEPIIFRDSMIGKNIKTPSLEYSGKTTIRLYEGEEFPDLSSYFTATDLLENIQDNIVIDYPEEMFGENNKVNKGTYNVEAYVVNSAGSKKSINIIVIVTNPDEIVVTFDGGNPTVYQIGDKISKPNVNPTKEGNEYVSYEFLAWTYNDVEWDFENDYVVSDMNLVSTYTTKNKEYLVTFENADGTSFTMNLLPGTEISKTMFAKEGYETKMTVDGVIVDAFVVNSDMTVKIEYSLLEQKEEKKGCGGSIAMAGTISMISLLGIVFVSLKRKGDK